jgi:hypothetical protein
MAFPSAKPALPSRDGHELETLTLAFLLNRGSNPALNLDALEPSAALVTDKYFTGAARFLKEKPEAQEGADKIGLNEFDEATFRILSGIKLLKTYVEEWKLDYVLLLWNPSSFHFRARVIDLSSREIVADVKALGTLKGWFQNNSFTAFESRKLAPKGMRFQFLTTGDKAALVFLYRALDAILEGGGGGGGGGGELPDDTKDW